MEFFNKKQDVIDLQLTQFGRFLLSRGKFKPTFYAFYDDNILYNHKSTGVGEEQNSAMERIKEAQVLKPQISFSSLEKNFTFNYEKVLSGKESALSLAFQKTAEKNYALPNLVGTSNINSEYAPAWQVQFLNGTLTGSTDFLDIKENAGGKNTALIPQVESEMHVKIMSIENLESDSASEPENEGLTDIVGDFAIFTEDPDLYVLLKVGETNGFFQKKNFDIEMYEVQEVTQDGQVIESLKPLSFSPAMQFINAGDIPDYTPPSPDTSYADYYFEILVDDEIDSAYPGLLCEHDPGNISMGVFADPRTKTCVEVLNEETRVVEDIYIDESDFPGEVC